MNQEKRRQRDREYYHNHKEAFRKKDKKRRDALTKEDKLIRGLAKHGISLEKYQEILQSQNNSCAVCGLHESGNIKGFRLYVDHDHNCCPTSNTSCGKCFRGLLCFHCNLALSHFQDSPFLVRKAAEYLDKHRPEDV